MVEPCLFESSLEKGAAHNIPLPCISNPTNRHQQVSHFQGLLSFLPRIQAPPSKVPAIVLFQGIDDALITRLAHGRCIWWKELDSNILELQRIRAHLWAEKWLRRWGTVRPSIRRLNHSSHSSIMLVFTRAVLLKWYR